MGVVLVWSSLPVVAAALVLGCGGVPSGPPAERERQVACRAPAGVSNQPESIDQTVALINALPKPLTLACFVESLARPLSLHAARSLLSAQPAVGARSPRVFLFLGPNIISVVPAGVGAQLLEMGEQRPDFRSLKGELSFPIAEQISPALPYTHALFAEGVTACAFCHAQETQSPELKGLPAFVSQSLRPLVQERVPLSDLTRELGACDAAVEPERCALLDALLGWGESLERDFPEEMATFVQ